MTSLSTPVVFKRFTSAIFSSRHPNGRRIPSFRCKALVCYGDALNEPCSRTSRSFPSSIDILEPRIRCPASSRHRASVIQFVIADHHDFLPKKVLFGSFASFLPVSKKKEAQCVPLFNGSHGFHVSMAGLGWLASFFQ